LAEKVPGEVHHEQGGAAQGEGAHDPEKPQGPVVAAGEGQPERRQQHAERRSEGMDRLADLVDQPVALDQVPAAPEGDVVILPHRAGRARNQQRRGAGRRGRRHAGAAPDHRTGGGRDLAHCSRLYFTIA
jgi:hypothetical protein